MASYISEMPTNRNRNAVVLGSWLRAFFIGGSSGAKKSGQVGTPQEVERPTTWRHALLKLQYLFLWQKSLWFQL